MAFDIEAEFSVDAYTAAVEAEYAADFLVDSYTAQVEAECLKPFQFDNDDSKHNENDDWGSEEEVKASRRKNRSPNVFEYRFGNVFNANRYTRFLSDIEREKTYFLSQCDRYG